MNGRVRERARPRIVIADAQGATRAGVRLALESDGFVICGEGATADDAVAAALDDPPDVCLLDVDMPGSGIAAAERIAAELPATRIVMLADSATDENLFASLEAGASGYLPKATNPERLGDALRDVLAGGAALPRPLTARLIDEFRARSRQSSLMRPTEHELTRREWDILDCLAEGLSTNAIARRLFITKTTVRRHVGSILRKLDVPTREAAVRAVARRSRNLNG
jgi:DNA-binding NarL/FixJ family response regulator